MMTAAQLEDLLGELTAADTDGDAETLAKICWQLHSELGEATARSETLQARLTAIALAVHDATEAAGTGSIRVLA